MCTRAIYNGNEKDAESSVGALTGGRIVTGRTMDWMSDLATNLWAFPAGLKHEGAGKKEVSWKSKYRSVTAAAHDATVADGLNDQGLMVNMLYLAESCYGEADDNTRAKISILNCGQYILNMYSSVEEAINEWPKSNFKILQENVPESDNTAAIHLSISDPKGDSAIFEYYNEGELHITTNLPNVDALKIKYNEVDFVEANSQNLTNSPIYPRQLKLNYFWEWQLDPENEK